MNDTTQTPPDLTVCDREPITRLEGIQSFGFLLAMSTDWLVARASANLEAILGIDANAAIGVRLDVLIDAIALQDIRTRVALLRGDSGIERLYRKTLIPGRPPFDLAVHYSESMLVLEGEPSRAEAEMDAAALMRSMMTRFSMRRSIQSFYGDATQQIQEITGFERVMIYRFGESGAGEVIAESLTNAMESFLGLSYPASDIPVQARTLYLRNPFRIIADVGALPVALLPVAAVGVQPLDLSLAMTRAVSPVHIEYLKNMQVAASLSISIIIDGALWGLIACHNSTPRLPDYGRRTAAELFGQLFSLTLGGLLKQSQLDADDNYRALVDRMTMTIAGNNALLANAKWLQETLREIVDCDGVATMMAGVLDASGSAPPRSQIEAITDRLNVAAAGQLLAVNNLASFIPAAADYASAAAGMLVIPISRTPRDYLLLFRREQQYDIRWAGNPAKEMVPSEQGARLLPRKSFEAFSQSVRGHARAFSARERRTAEVLRSALVDVILQTSSAAEQERRKSSERQELLIAELNHRVRNILALIRGLTSQTNDGSHGDVSAYVGSLDGRIQALARAHDQINRQNWGPAKLSVLMNQEISAYIPERHSRFTLIGPPVALTPLAFSTISLVIHEMVTNSAKYGSLSDSGRVMVNLERETGVGLYIKWREIDGPVVRLPLRRGFGSVIIERIVPTDLQGTAEIRFAPTGLEADFFIPEIHIAPSDPDSEEHEMQSPDDTGTVTAALTAEPALKGCSVLLLEDNMIIALDTKSMLRELGATAIFTASTTIRAEEIFRAEHLDFAVLDINLGVNTSLGFAQLLREASIPFIFVSGYGENESLGAMHGTSLTVTKPFSVMAIGAAITKCRTAALSSGAPAKSALQTVPRAAA